MNFMIAKMPTGKEDEINEFNLPQIPEEEVLKYTLQEDLSESERIKVLLQKQNSTQQSYVFHNAVNIFKGDPQTQEQIIPLILKSMGSYSEEIQTEAGQAFSLILQANILDCTYYKDLKQVCIVMLKQWSKQILAKWIDVYTLLLPRFILTEKGNTDKLEKECIEIVMKMSDLGQPISVRLSSTYFLAQIAANRTLSKREDFIQKILPKIKQLCQDFNWEIRKEMCRHLYKVSLFIGHELTISELFNDLMELVEDEEHEVKHQAIKSYCKHTQKIFTDEFNQSNKCLAVAKIIFHIALDEMCPSDIRSSVLMKANRLIIKLNNSSDDELTKAIQTLISMHAPIESGKLQVTQMIEGISTVNSKSNRFIADFYLQVLRQFLKDEINGQNIATKIAIAQTLHFVVISAVKAVEPQVGNLVEIKQEIFELYSQLLKQNNKEITNTLIIKAHEVFECFYKNQSTIDKTLYKIFTDKIRRPLLLTVDKTIQTNWRYHLNYFQFLSKLFNFLEKEEITLEILPLFLKGLRYQSCSLPVKTFIANGMANSIAQQANFFLRQSIQEIMIKEFGISSSSQTKLVFLIFLESLLPQISKAYFKQMFKDSYFNFREEQVILLLLHYVKIAPMVRMKLDDFKSIDRLEQSLVNINKKFLVNKKATDLLLAIEDTLIQIRDSKFLQEVQEYQQSRDKEIHEKELMLSELEKNEKDGVKRKEMEGMLKGMRDDYMKKIHSINSSNNGRSMTSMKSDKKSIGGGSVGVSSKLNVKGQQKGDSVKSQKEETKAGSSSQSKRNSQTSALSSNGGSKLSTLNGIITKKK